MHFDPRNRGRPRSGCRSPPRDVAYPWQPGREGIWQDQEDPSAGDADADPGAQPGRSGGEEGEEEDEDEEEDEEEEE